MSEESTRVMNDEEIGLNFFTEGEPRSPEGLPSVFGAIDQAEMLARIDEVQDDDLASSFFADSLIEVEAAATRVFDVGVRPRPEPVAEPPVVGAAPTTAALSPDDVLAAPSVPASVAGVAQVAAEAVVVDSPPPVRPETAARDAPPAADETPADDAAEPTSVEPTRSSRLGAAREEVVALRTRTVITVPGILSKSADARRAFILGGPAALSEIDID